MHIGNMGEMREFKQQQLSKVEKRKKEDEKIRKGVSQMHSMIQSSCMETLDEETKKSRERVSERVTNENKGESGEKPGKDKKTDGKAARGNDTPAADPKPENEEETRKI